MMNLKNGQVRVIYAQWFGDDQYVADFDDQAAAAEMLQLDYAARIDAICGYTQTER